MFTIARHRILDWRRREARAPVVSRPVDDFAERAASNDPATDTIEHLDTDTALDLIRTLPTDESEVVILRAVAGLDVAHVARVIGKPTRHRAGPDPAWAAATRGSNWAPSSTALTPGW